MNRTMLVGLVIGIASLGVLVGAGARRSRHAPEARASVPLPPPEEEQRAETREEAEEERSGREDVLRRTEDSLGLGPEEAPAFRSTVLSAVEDVDRAWAVREAGWIAVSSSAASDPELLERLEGEIQFRYESEKERALQRVAAHLRGSERGERLLERLEEWFDGLR
jgi:hypothetical protein